MLSITVLLIFGCTEFLDLVPDSQLTLDMIFSMKEDAWNALAKVYSYIPADERMGRTPWLLGDEYMTSAQENRDHNRPAMNIMRGNQTASDPQLGYWQGTGGASHLYKGIRNANIFLEKIDLVSDMPPQEIAEWKSQVKFLKAYFHFILLRSYGPIIIYDEAMPADATGDDVYKTRSKVDDCFDYIIKLIDESIPDLRETTSSTNLGQINQIIAKAMKARILLYRASPFYSGNKEYYEDFLDLDGKPYFPVYDTQEDTKRKWKDALDAVEEALTACDNAGVELYHYEKAMFAYDRNDADTVPERMQTLYDLRMLVCDPWNKELIWGLSNVDAGADPISNFTNIMLPDSYLPGSELANNSTHCDQNVGATYHMLETYYTKNGLPPEEDQSFNWASRHNIIVTPGVETLEYEAYRGFLQPGASTIYFYTNREPRFYANLGITGGYWRAHEMKISTDFLADSYYGGGGFLSAKADNYIYTGIGIQKFVHPESKAGHWMRLVAFPFPVIRLADLYLMKAEALNEYLDAPTQDVYDAINAVRTRAGIPAVEASWGGEFVKADFLDKHKTKDGMREIIKRERANELAFEGARYWDLVRWRDAVGEFSKPAVGWSPLKSTVEAFFVQEIKQIRKFSYRDCLTPIHINELNKNSNLKQNPGW
ncbi:MAG: RagB/SusD family nutrient uptake outer membrane protein [Tannerellaceae bacterium]|nr:RagB/SusD family nutrient uptake outer membrane protein [Tannerellaceae bacterium]